MKQANTIFLTAGYGFAWLLLANCCLAQTAPFQVPEETQTVDFSLKNKQRRIVFLDDGEAVEVPLVFSMIKYPKISVIADLPEPGRFDVQLVNSKALAEVRGVATEGKQGRAEVVAKFKAVSLEEIEAEALKAIDELLPAAGRDKARQEANKRKEEELRAYLLQQKLPNPADVEELKSMYVRVRALEGKSDLMRDKLDEFAKRHARWFDKDEKLAWDSAKSGALFLALFRAEVLERGDKYLSTCGLSFDRSTKNASENIFKMVQAVYVVATGRAADDRDVARKASEALGATGVAQLRDALTVQLSCRLYAPGGKDNKDPNAQWFAAQRVTCKAREAASIRVAGRLDPAQGDRVDWWILNRYDADNISLEASKDAAVQFDPPLVDGQTARLRVSATGDTAADYWFELRSGDGSGEHKVLIHESPAVADAKFPF